MGYIAAIVLDNNDMAEIISFIEENECSHL